MDAFQYIIAFTAGAGLGLFFFGGLWMTVQRLPRARHPALLAAGSLLLRVSLSVVGFYLVMDGYWERLLVCLAGFVLMKVLLVRHRTDRSKKSTGRGEGDEAKP